MAHILSYKSGKNNLKKSKNSTEPSYDFKYTIEVGETIDIGYFGKGWERAITSSQPFDGSQGIVVMLGIEGQVTGYNPGKAFIVCTDTINGVSVTICVEVRYKSSVGGPDIPPKPHPKE